jgi:hypothetical protein
MEEDFAPLPENDFPAVDVGLCAEEGCKAQGDPLYCRIHKERNRQTEWMVRMNERAAAAKARIDNPQPEQPAQQQQTWRDKKADRIAAMKAMRDNDDPDRETHIGKSSKVTMNYNIARKHKPLTEWVNE